MENSVYRYLYMILVVLVFPSCTGKQEQIVGKVDDRIISLEEFRTFYELDPNFGIDSSGSGALSDELNKYIDQILAYTRADEMDLLRDSVFIKGRDWEMRQAMLRELYRQQVQYQITVDDKDLRAEFLKGTIQVHVRQLFTRELDQAERWYIQLTQGDSFQTLAREAFQDTVLAENGGDLGWVPLNSLDEDFGNVILTLQQNEITKPVHTPWGYHIIQLLDRRDQVIISETDFEHQRPSLEKKIRQRKGRQLASQYISNFIGKYNPQPDPSTFRFLWQHTVPDGQQENKILSLSVELNDERIHHIQQNYGAYLDKPLVNYKNGTFTLGEYLHRVAQMPYGNRPRFKTVEQLSNQLGSWVRDELLFREAKKRNLDREQRVMADVHSIMEQQFYNMFVEQEISALFIPDSVLHYFKLPIRGRAGKNQDLSHFHNLEEWRWVEAEKNMHRKLRHQDISIWIDQDMLQQESRSIHWDQRIRMIMVRR